MKILLIILFPFICFAQTDVLVSSVVYSAISGQTEYYRIKDRQLFADGNKDYKDYSRKWHALQYPEMASAISVGVTIGINENLSVESVVKETLLAGSVRWIVRDAVYNLNLHRNVFNISDESYSFTEKLGTWYIKVGLLAVILLWNYL